MSKGKILGMALEAIGKGADEVADVAKAGKSAARKALDAVAEAGDDWGWKGGKPGEITADEFVNSYNKARNAAKQAVAAVEARYPSAPDYELAGVHYDVFRDSFGDLDKRMYKQLSASKNPFFANVQDVEEIPNLMVDMEKLQRAGIPREWTGKVLPAVNAYAMKENLGFIPYSLADYVSRSMRPLTNDQRETFLSLLPEWTESLDDLADLARNI